MKSLLILCLSILLINVACNEEITNDSIQIKGTEPIVSVVDGILSFNNSSEAMKTIQILSRMGMERRRKWEQENGFYSLKRRTEEGFDAINQANIVESESMLNKALKDYSDVIELRDSVYEPKYDFGPFDLIINLDGLFITSDVVQKITPKGIDIYKITALNSLKKGIEQIPICSYEYFSGTKNSKNNGPNELQAEYFDNPSGCKDDRRVYVQTKVMTIYSSWVVNIDGLDVYYMKGTSGFYAKTWGTQRNWLCNWSRYSTLLAVRNVSATFYVYQNELGRNYYDPSFGEVINTTSTTFVPYTYTYPDYTTESDSYEDEMVMPCGHIIVNEQTAYNEFLNNYSGFISCHFEGSSRGVGLYVNWAVIDY